MNQRIKELVEQAYEMKPYMVADPETFEIVQKIGYDGQPMFHRDFNREKFAELIMKDTHKKVIASILITDVTMEEKGQVPTSEDYIRAINKHFGIEE